MTKPILLILALLAGCAHPPADAVLAEDGRPEAVDTTVHQDDSTDTTGGHSDAADALRALGVFEVGDLLAPEVPDEAYNCYGVCPEWQDEVDQRQAVEETAGRLAALAAEAVKVDGPADGADAASDLEILRSLQVIEVGDLVVEEGVPSPYCYNLVCPDEQERVDAANAERAADLHRIAVASFGLFGC